MTQTDDANVGAVGISLGGPAAVERGDHSEDPVTIESGPASSIGLLGARGERARQSSGETMVADENQRARLIADIGRLIREPAVPEHTRLAGLTLIGWLARRRPEESPHAVGVAEARACEQRLRTRSAK